MFYWFSPIFSCFPLISSIFSNSNPDFGIFVRKSQKSAEKSFYGSFHSKSNKTSEIRFSIDFYLIFRGFLTIFPQFSIQNCLFSCWILDVCCFCCYHILNNFSSQIPNFLRLFNWRLKLVPSQIIDFFQLFCDFFVQIFCLDVKTSLQTIRPNRREMAERCE